ncbi:TetR/AcrR family transcriptional regulator [Paenibacillus sp. FSL H8-0537]|uniref:TetR/AcrR family transcriptional regulator n=1 Tax=Paenibacillus sp. FSL H8-0537 TaxID=2921399 RepID=UPI003100BD1B
MKKDTIQVPASKATAERLKHAALTIFTEFGYEGTSMSDIAKAVQIKTPSIYAHFKSKEQLFLELCADVIAEEGMKFEELMQQSQGRPVLERLREVYDFFTDFPHLTVGQWFLKRMMLMPPKHLQQQFRVDFLEHEQRVDAIVGALFLEGQQAGIFPQRDVENMIAVFYTLLDGLLVANQIYEQSVFSSHKQTVWEMLEKDWTTA